MKKTQFIDTLRNIRANFISWLAIVIVVMITCGVYCGVFYYADAMENKADEFYKKNNLNDLTIISAMGLCRARQLNAECLAQLGLIN